MRAGFALLGVGLLIDLGYHAVHGIGAHPTSIPCCGVCFWAYAVTIAGMLLSIVAVFQEAVRATRRARRAAEWRR